MRFTETATMATSPRTPALAVVAAVVVAVVLVVGGVPVLAGLVGGVGAAAILWTATARFELFILVLIAVRSCIDVTKTSYRTPIEIVSLTGMLMIAVTLAWLAMNMRNPAQAPFGSTPGTVDARAGRGPSMLTVGIAAFAVAAFVSAIASDKPMTSANEALRVLAAALMYFAVKRLLELGMSYQRVIVAIAVSTILPLTVPAVGKKIGIEVNQVKDGIAALRSTFHLSNNLAHYLMLIVIMSMALIRYLHGWKRWAAVAIASIGAYELMLASTRGAWFGVAVGVAVLAAIDNRRLGLIALGVAVVAFTTVPVVSERLQDIQSDPEKPREIGSLEWRFDHWEQIISLRDDNPMTGTGLGRVRELSEQRAEPHNDYVLALVETGYLGLAAYLTLVVGYLISTIRALNRSRGLQRGLAVGMVAVGFAFIVDSVAENLVTGLAFMWYLMPLAACADWIARGSPRVDRGRWVSAADDPEIVDAAPSTSAVRPGVPG